MCHLLYKYVSRRHSLTPHVGAFVGVAHRLVWKVLFGEMRSLNDCFGLGSAFLVSVTLWVPRTWACPSIAVSVNSWAEIRCFPSYSFTTENRKYRKKEGKENLSKLPMAVPYLELISISSLVDSVQFTDCV